MAKKKETPDKNPQSPRMTIRFPFPKLLTEIETLAEKDGRDPSAYARNVLRLHVEEQKRKAS